MGIELKKFLEIIQNIDKCSAGTVKIEYPQEFRQFLQKNPA